jgi:phosphohistidine phosphatase
MKRLIVIRHAKSSWDYPHNDIDRPLEARGRKDAEHIAAACQKYLPEQFVIQCSIAKRAYETCTIIANGIGYPLDRVIFQEALYTFDDHQLERVVRAFNDDYQNVILFGHNEAITNFVNKFGSVFIDNVPTCGFILLQFDTSEWMSIDKGITLKTIFPKDLK